MTDAEMVERCAEFMGWHRGANDTMWLNAKDDAVACIYHSEYSRDGWNPLTRPADTWMLLDRLVELEIHHYVEHDPKNDPRHEAMIWHTGSQAWITREATDRARAIVDCICAYQAAR